MAKLFNRAKMTTATTGSGTVTLGSASNGFQTFAAAGVSNGDVVQYVIEEGANFEIGTGTYSSTGTSLTRSPTESSNSDNAITLAGQATVSITAVADDLNRLQHGGSDKVTVSSTGASVTGNLAVSGTVDGRDVASDGSKLDGIESGATADQTAAQIRAKVEAASDSNVFTDADHSKLNAIEAGATGDQTNAEIRAAVEAATDSNVFTDADHSKLNGIEANAKNDQTITAGGGLTGGGTGDVTISHSDTSSQSSVNNSSGTVIQDVTLDGYGHVTGLASVNLDGRYYTESESDTRFLRGNTSDTMSGNLTVDNGTSTTLSVKCDNGGNAIVRAGGDGQGTGVFEVTQDNGSHGGGISYNGDGSPAFASGETADHVTFYRIASGTRTEVFHYPYNSNTVNFNSTPTAGGTSLAKTTDIGNGTLTVQGTGALGGSGTFTANQSGNTTISISHDDTSSQASVNGSGRTYIQDVTLDAYGHVTGLATGTETVVNTDTNTNQLTTFQVEDGDGTEVTISHGKEWKFREAGGININWTDTSTGSDGDPFDLSFNINTSISAGGGLTGGGQLNATRTISHADTSSQGSVNYSGNTVIQDVTLDTYGHVTGLGAKSLSLLDLGYTGATDANNYSFPYTVSASASNSTVVQRHSSGYIYANYFNTTPNDISVGSITKIVAESGNDGFMRHASAAAVRNFLNVANGATANQGDITNVSAGGGLTGGGSSGGVTLSHSDTSSQASVNNSGNTVIQDVTLDGYGHVTGLTSTALSIPAAANNATITLSAGTGLSGGGNFTTNQSSAETITFNLEAPYTYIDTATGNYGTIKVDDDRGVSWAGYAIRDDWVLMSNGADTVGIYNDTDNEWAIKCIRNAETELYHNGALRLETSANGIEMSGRIDMNNNDIYGCDQIFHHGDTNTYMNFHAADQWRVVVGGSERLEVKNSSPHVLVSGDLNSTSDERLKKNIKPIDNALADICQLEGVTFDWKDTGTQGQGFIAQQVEPIIPDVVNTDEDSGMKSINYVGLIGHLVEAIKEQQTQIDDLKAEIQSMKS